VLAAVLRLVGEDSSEPCSWLAVGQVYTCTREHRSTRVNTTIQQQAVQLVGSKPGVHLHKGAGRTATRVKRAATKPTETHNRWISRWTRCAPALVRGSQQGSTGHESSNKRT
jgi:hypothetical protein